MRTQATSSVARCDYSLPDDSCIHIRLYSQSGEKEGSAPQCLLKKEHDGEPHLFLVREPNNSLQLLCWEKEWDCECTQECECAIYWTPMKEELDALLGLFFSAELPSTPEE